MQHKFIKKIALAAVVTTLFANFANADCLNLKSGKDYTDIKLSTNHVVKLSEQEVKSAKPVLVEFFWYGCSHCYHMDPMISKLVSQHENKIIFKRYPVNFPRWDSGAKLFFTVQEMGLEEKLHTKIFDVIHKQHINIMDNKAERDKFLKRENVDVQKFDSIYNSFGINTKMKQASDVAKNYNLRSSPVFVINNKYQIDPALTQSYEATLKSMDQMLKGLETKQCK